MPFTKVLVSVHNVCIYKCFIPNIQNYSQINFKQCACTCLKIHKVIIMKNVSSWILGHINALHNFLFFAILSKAYLFTIPPIPQVIRQGGSGQPPSVPFYLRDAPWVSNFPTSPSSHAPEILPVSNSMCSICFHFITITYW